MTKPLTRLVDMTRLVMQGFRSGLDLAGAAFFLLLAGWLGYLMRNTGLFLIIPAMIGGKGASLALRALEPFGGNRSLSPDRRGPSDLAKMKGPPQRGGPSDPPIRRSQRRPLRP
jgi:hypothetical protein